MIFLRPFFLLFLFVPFILMLIQKKRKSFQTAWAKECDLNLLPYLVINVASEKTKFYNFLMTILWCLFSVALSGPAILQKEAPTSTMQSGLVVVVDMSPVMDEKALEQMTYKLYDLVELKKDMNIGIVLADKQAYIGLPLTQDKSIVRNIVGQLKEKNIMPSIGQNIPTGIKNAEKLLEQSGFKKGQILVLTAGTDDAFSLAKNIKNAKYPVFVIGVGSKREKEPVKLDDGSFWNGGRMYGLSDMKSALSEKFQYATIDDADLKKIIASAQEENIKTAEHLTRQYQDFGIWLIVLMFPFVVLLFRKGVLFAFFIMSFISQANAGWFERQEQEDYYMQMAAVSAFNAKDYQAALDGFSKLADADTEALYNQANTLAFMGNIEGAIQIYEQVLKQNPQNEDAVFNLNYLKEFLKEQKQQQEQQQDQQQNNKQEETEKKENSSNEQAQQKDSASKEDEANSKDDLKEQSDENQKEQSEDKQTDTTVVDKSNKQEETSPEQKESQSDQKRQDRKQTTQEQQTEKMNVEKADMIDAETQKQKEWMNRINSDAGRVLRYRLKQQYGVQK